MPRLNSFDWKMRRPRLDLLSFLVFLIYAEVSTEALIGGIVPMSQGEILTKEFGDIVQHTTHWYNSQSNKSHWHNPVRIADATKQVIQGKKYRYNLHLKATDCQMQDILLQMGQPADMCRVNNESPLVICSASVWHRPWLNDTSKISEIEDCWEVTELDLLLTETKHLPKKKISQNITTMTDIEDAINALNLRGLYKNVYRFVNYTEDPDGMIQVILNETACPTVNDMSTLENIKSSECYDQQRENTLRCTIFPTKRHHLQNCGPVDSSPLKYMWRSNEKPESGKKQEESLHGSWIRQPYSFEAELYVQPKTVGFENTEKFKSMVRKSVEVYNRRSNDIFMRRAVETILLLAGKSPMERTKLEIEFSATKCRKSEEYLSDFNRFMNECIAIQTAQPIQKCIVWIAVNKVHLEHCEAKKPEGNLVSMEQDKYITKFDQKEGLFLELLKNVTDHFTDKIRPGSNLSILAVSNLMSTPGLIKMVTWFGECDSPEVPCEKDKIPSEEMLKDFVQCDVEHHEKQLSNKSAQIRITNCWQAQKLARFEPLSASWNKLPSVNIDNRETSAIIDQAVRSYNERSHRSNSKLDYVSDVFQMNTGGRKELHFVLHLKKKSDSKRSHSDSHKTHHQKHHSSRYRCNVIFVGDGENNRTTLFNCKHKELPKRTRVGAPRIMNQEELDSSEFDRMLWHATKTYNHKMRPEYAYRLHGFKDVQVQLVAGTMTMFKAYYVQTACKRIAEGDTFRMENPVVCGSENMTHVTVCQVQVWRKSWLEKFEKYNFLDCQTLPRNTTLLNDVRVFPSELHLRAPFKGIVAKAAMVVNANLYNSTNYFKVEQVTNFEEEDGATNVFTFKMFMRPTTYIKGEHEKLFFESQENSHHSRNNSDLLICSVKYTTDPIKREDIEFNILSCVLVQRLEKQGIKPQHNATLSEINNSEFQENIQLAIQLFNKAFGTSFMYGRPQVENVVAEDVVGELVNFQIHLFPDPCISTVMTIPRCEALTSSAVVTCNVRTWQQPWNRDHKLIHIDGCVRYQKPSVDHREQESEVRKDIKDRVVPQLIKLLDGAVGSRHNRFGRIAVENITQETTAGRWTNFELLLKVNQSDCNGRYHTEKERKRCEQLEPFYQCRAVAWLRPWLNNNELHQLSHCKMIKYKPMKNRTTENLLSGSTRKLEHMTDKAVETYNQHIIGDYIYGSPESSNVENENMFGSKTEFYMRMKPIACRPRTKSADCKVEKFTVSVSCQVIFHEKPWSAISQVVSLQHCRKFYGDGDRTGTKPLTQEEQNSAEFQQTLDTLVKMYRPPVPIVYTVKTIENATVTYGNKRNITFNVVFQPTGCNSSLPNASDSSCLQWYDQMPIQCGVVISDDEEGVRRFYLRNCNQLLRTEAKRLLTETEIDSTWFTKSIRDTVAMHRKIFNPKMYFKANGIEDAYIQRELDEVVTYKLKLSETDCLLPEDEIDIPHLFLDECDITSRTNYICKVLLKKRSNGSTNHEIKCATSANANLLD